MRIDLDLAVRRLAAADPEAMDALLSNLEEAVGDYRQDAASGFCYPNAVGRVRGMVQIARIEGAPSLEAKLGLTEQGEREAIRERTRSLEVGR